MGKEGKYDLRLACVPKEIGADRTGIKDVEITELVEEDCDPCRDLLYPNNKPPNPINIINWVASTFLEVIRDMTNGIAILKPIVYCLSCDYETLFL